MSRQSGYTLVEVMMALTILAIGAAGLFSLQSVAIQGNTEAANLSAASNIARGWIDHIKTDALSWNSAGPLPPNDIADTALLDTLGAAWTSLSVTGNPQRRDGTEAANGLFCAQARAIAPTSTGVLGAINGLEVTVRVWWFKGKSLDRAGFANCGQAVAAAMTGDLQRFHWVYMTTLVTPHPQL